MKKVITFVFALGFVLYLSDIATYAQSRGTGHGPAVSSAHVPDNHSTTDHGKSADHTKNTTKDTKAAHDNSSWVNNLNPNLKAQLTGLIPTDAKITLADGSTRSMTLADIAGEFKNKGQCIAFLHVANNLKLTTPQWMDMLNRMTGPDHESVGKALHDAVPTLSATQVKTETEKAEEQAHADLKVKTKPTS